ncbi:MAG: mannosyltransferase family protein [Ktedonobacterales bacterium]
MTETHVSGQQDVTHQSAAPPLTLAPTATQPRLFNRGVWRDAALLWLGQHILFLVVTYLGRPLAGLPSFSNQAIPWSTFFTPWLGWDVGFYAQIARDGYSWSLSPAFFPLLPLLERVVGPLTGGDYAVAGAVIANICGFGVLALMRLLAERELGLAAARRATLYLAVFPTAFYLATGYAESLLLLLTLGSFLAMRRERWLLAGALAALATLARPTGIALVAALVVEIGCVVYRKYQQGERLHIGEGARMLAALAAAPVALGGFVLYLYTIFHSFGAISHAQAAWGRSLTVPFLGFLRDGGALLEHGLDPNFYQAHILLDVAFSAAWIALSVAMWRRLPWPYLAYAWLVALIAFATPAHNWQGLFSNMRFMLVVFPIFFLLGRWGRQAWVDRLILGSLLPLLALLTLLFILRRWVA